MSCVTHVRADVNGVDSVVFTNNDPSNFNAVVTLEGSATGTLFLDNNNPDGSIAYTAGICYRVNCTPVVVGPDPIHSMSQTITVIDGNYQVGDTPPITASFVNTGNQNIDSLTIELIHPDPPCAIVDVDVVSDATTAQVTWTIRNTDTGQDKVGTGQICYGTDPNNLDTLGPNENTFIYSTHIQRLNPLQPNTLYHYEIKSMDVNGFLVTHTGNFITT